MRTLFSLAIVAGFVCTSVVSAQEEGGPASNARADVGIPAEFQDPAFEQYVELEFLRDAWIRLDPAALADAGLQLAEGERVLYRQHNAISAEDVLQLAAKVAVEKRDKTTIERLAKAAEQLNRGGLVKMIAAVKKIADEPRAVPSSVALPLDQVSMDAIGIIGLFVTGIEQARITGDTATLELFAQEVAGKADWPHASRAGVLRLIEDARAKMAKRDETHDPLDRLAGATRGTGTWVIMNATSSTQYIKVHPFDSIHQIPARGHKVIQYSNRAWIRMIPHQRHVLPRALAQWIWWPNSSGRTPGVYTLTEKFSSNVQGGPGLRVYIKP